MPKLFQQVKALLKPHHQSGSSSSDRRSGRNAISKRRRSASSNGTRNNEVPRQPPSPSLPHKVIPTPSPVKPKQLRNASETTLLTSCSSSSFHVSTSSLTVMPLPPLASPPPVAVVGASATTVSTPDSSLDDAMSNTEESITTQTTTVCSTLNSPSSQVSAIRKSVLARASTSPDRRGLLDIPPAPPKGMPTPADMRAPRSFSFRVRKRNRALSNKDFEHLLEAAKECTLDPVKVQEDESRRTIAKAHHNDRIKNHAYGWNDFERYVFDRPTRTTECVPTAGAVENRSLRKSLTRIEGDLRPAPRPNAWHMSGRSHSTPSNIATPALSNRGGMNDYRFVHPLLLNKKQVSTTPSRSR